MAGPEIGFLFQFGTIREIVTTNASTLTLSKLKELACEFITTKVSPNFTSLRGVHNYENSEGLFRSLSFICVLFVCLTFPSKTVAKAQRHREASHDLLLCKQQEEILSFKKISSTTFYAKYLLDSNRWRHFPAD